MLLVEHTRCAEHGELVHGDQAHPHHAEADAGTDRTALRSASKDGAEDTHEHCAFAVDRRDALIEIVDAQPFGSLVEALGSMPSASPFVALDAERFRLAPKNSPPA